MVLASGRRVREHADALADLFVRVLRAHTTESEPAQLRPLARAVMDAELSMALDRRLRRSPEPQVMPEP